MKILATILLVTLFHCSFSQHIQYRDKRKPEVPSAASGGTAVADNLQPATPQTNRAVIQKTADTIAQKMIAVKPLPVMKDTIARQPVTQVEKPVVRDTTAKISAPPAKAVEQPDTLLVTKKKLQVEIVKKKMPELITGCKLSADPDKMAQLPLVINDVAPELVAKLKERYKNRIYSITGLNMIDVRLKMKLKICDKDGGKFRIEYLNKDGEIVNDPSLDYFEY